MIATAFLVAALLVPAPAPSIVPASCPAWQSIETPPRYIRIRVSDRLIVRVAFPLYVARVVSSEWNTVPTELRRAGAVAARQYGWWKALHPRRSQAGCFDVYGDTRDQIYRVKTPPDYVWAAVRATWSWRVLRSGRLIQTGYRTGRPALCARDIDGFHLFARSGARCANAGWGARRILAAYYQGHVR